MSDSLTQTAQAKEEPLNYATPDVLRSGLIHLRFRIDENLDVPHYREYHLEVIDAALKLLADHDAQTRQDWQPIETAPKDGTPVLGYHARYALPDPVWWDGFGWRWRQSELEIKYTGCSSSFPPTHWQPISAPPAQKGTP